MDDHNLKYYKIILVIHFQLNEASIYFYNYLDNHKLGLETIIANSTFKYSNPAPLNF